VSIVDETIQLLQASDTSRDDLARQLGVSRRWLYKLQAGQITDPGARKIERLHSLLQQTSHSDKVA